MENAGESTKFSGDYFNLIFKRNNFFRSFQFAKVHLVAVLSVLTPLSLRSVGDDCVAPLSPS